MGWEIFAHHSSFLTPSAKFQGEPHQWAQNTWGFENFASFD